MLLVLWNTLHLNCNSTKISLGTQRVVISADDCAMSCPRTGHKNWAFDLRSGIWLQGCRNSFYEEVITAKVAHANQHWCGNFIHSGTIPHQPFHKFVETQGDGWSVDPWLSSLDPQWARLKCKTFWPSLLRSQGSWSGYRFLNKPARTSVDFVIVVHTQTKTQTYNPHRQIPLIFQVTQNQCT